jgi:DNA-binding NarL/FixJ family response regulator
VHEKILVLEDDAPLLEGVIDALEDQQKEKGYRVVGCLNPADALEAALNGDFDLFITDVKMRGFVDGGIGVLREVKKNCPSIYSIVMTGFPEDNSEVKAMEFGIDFFIKKPFGTAYLLTAVEQVLTTKTINSTIQKQVKGVFSSIQRSLDAMVGRKRDEPAHLEVERNLFYRAYYVGIQSDKLTEKAALLLWDKLIELEFEYEGLREIIGQRVDALALKYRSLRSECQEFTGLIANPPVAKREGRQIPRDVFVRLYRRIRTGQVSNPLLLCAPSLWTLQFIRPWTVKSPDFKGLWTQLFGEDDKALESKNLFAELIKRLDG